MIPDGRTPVVVVTGFVGSGKTTLVNRLLKKQPDSLVIVNEFGEVPVDHLLVESSTEKTVPLPNGCLCFALKFEQPVGRELLERFISTLVDLRGADLLRVKGIVPLESGLVLVQGVRHVFDRLRPVDRGAPALVFITNGVERSEVEALWRAMARLERS